MLPFILATLDGISTQEPNKPTGGRSKKIIYREKQFDTQTEAEKIVN